MVFYAVFRDPPLVLILNTPKISYNYLQRANPITILHIIRSIIRTGSYLGACWVTPRCASCRRHWGRVLRVAASPAS